MGIRRRIVDRDGELQRVAATAVVPFLDAHIGAVRIARIVEPGPVVHPDRLHHEGVVILPLANRVSVPARIRILGKRSSVGPNDSPGLPKHVQHENLVWRLDDLLGP